MTGEQSPKFVKRKRTCFHLGNEPGNVTFGLKKEVNINMSVGKVTMTQMTEPLTITLQHT